MEQSDYCLHLLRKGESYYITNFDNELLFLWATGLEEVVKHLDSEGTFVRDGAILGTGNRYDPKAQDQLYRWPHMEWIGRIRG